MAFEYILRALAFGAAHTISLHKGEALTTFLMKHSRESLIACWYRVLREELSTSFCHRFEFKYLLYKPSTAWNEIKSGFSIWVAPAQLWFFLASNIGLNIVKSSVRETALVSCQGILSYHLLSLEITSCTAWQACCSRIQWILGGFNLSAGCRREEIQICYVLSKLLCFLSQSLIIFPSVNGANWRHCLQICEGLW